MPSIFITPAGIAGGLTASTNLDIFANGASSIFAITNVGRINFHERLAFSEVLTINNQTFTNISLTPTITTLTSTTPFNSIISMLDINPTVIFNAPLDVMQYFAINATGTFTSIIGPFLSTYNLFKAASVLSSGLASQYVVSPIILQNASIMRATAAVNVGTTPIAITARDAAQLDASVVGSTITITEWNSFVSSPQINAVGTANVITRRAFQVGDFGLTGAGTFTATTNIGVDIGTQAAALTAGATSVGIRSAIVANALNYFLRDTGGAQCAFAGKFTTYNNIATLGFGVPAITDVITTQTGKTANITATAFTNASTAGLYRIGYYLEVTTTAAVPTITATIAYTDDGVARTVVSAVVAFVTNSTTAGFTQGEVFVRLASGSITYATTLVGAIGTGVYSFYASCERIN